MKKIIKKIKQYSLLFSIFLLYPLFNDKQMQFNYVVTPNNIIKKIGVRWGELGFVNNEEIGSLGYSSCSALILDYKDSAVMGHAYPGNNSQKGYFDHLEIDAGKIVDCSIDLLKKKGINSKNTHALVYSGNLRDHKLILNRLKRKGIEVKFSKYSKGGPTRDIKYNPVTDSLFVAHRDPPDSYGIF